VGVVGGVGGLAVVVPVRPRLVVKLREWPAEGLHQRVGGRPTVAVRAAVYLCLACVLPCVHALFLLHILKPKEPPLYACGGSPLPFSLWYALRHYVVF